VIKLTHNNLVKIAGRWLFNAQGCNPVFTERGSARVPEIPDAIGWTAHDCIVVECKVSRNDLKANANKSIHLGTKRFIMLPEGLYDECVNYVPQGYGIVTVNELGYAQQVRSKCSQEFERDLISENHYLRSRILAIQNYGKF
jgi:hypothetical protein